MSKEDLRGKGGKIYEPRSTYEWFKSLMHNTFEVTQVCLIYVVAIQYPSAVSAAFLCLAHLSLIYSASNVRKRLGRNLKIQYGYVALLLLVFSTKVVCRA